MASSAARMRFLYLLNIIIPGSLSLLHLMDPDAASRSLWAGSGRAGASAGVLNPPLALPMLGSWWAAVALISLLGLRDPVKYSPLMLAQTLYKLVFLGAAVLPLALAGRAHDIPVQAVLPYALYLAPLAVCSPWGYLLGGKTAGGLPAHGKAE